MKKILATLLLSLALFVSSGPATLAADETTVEPEKEQSSDSFNVFDVFTLENGEESSNLVEDLKEEGDEKQTSPIGAVILRAINILTLLVGTFAFVMIVIGGFMFMTAAGDESRVDRGKAVLGQAILGLVLAFFSYYIVIAVQTFFY